MINKETNLLKFTLFVKVSLLPKKLILNFLIPKLYSRKLINPLKDTTCLHLKARREEEKEMVTKMVLIFFSRKSVLKLSLIQMIQLMFLLLTIKLHLIQMKSLKSYYFIYLFLFKFKNKNKNKKKTRLKSEPKKKKIKIKIKIKI